MAEILHNGTAFPVTEAWATTHCDPWPSLVQMTREGIDAERQRILQISNARRLKPDERAYLTSLDAHYNVRNALTVLGVDDPASEAFAFMGADQLHGNRIQYDCGCELVVVFDHHEAMAAAEKGAEGPETQPWIPFYVCDDHAHLEGDLTQLHAAVHCDAQARVEK